MSKRYDKLIRDRIPQILTQNGIKYETMVLSDGEFEAALRTKLVEEATEAACLGYQFHPLDFGQDSKSHTTHAARR